jgi:adenosine deaminase
MPRDLTDLHIHVGGAVAPHVLWSIAHDQGFKLPVSDYWEFRELVSARPGKVHSLEEYLAVLHTWTERIQSSPQAMERSVYEIIGKEYRGSRVDLIELRFNPMKRNVGGERDLDHIIHASLRGMDRAVLEYGVRAGLIFCLAREFEPRLNEILVEKAIKYRRRGVVGIDLAGAERNALELDPAEVPRYRELFRRARAAGLKTTVHTGETAGTGAEGVRAVVEQLEPERIGHGIRAAQDERVMDLLRERGVVLEICPTSNLATCAVASLDELKEVLQRFWAHGVRFTINTDGPYLLDTTMRREVDLLHDSMVLADEQIEQAFRWAREATFLPPAEEPAAGR